MYFIIGGDGKQYGPISGDDLRKWIAEGRLNAQSQAMPEGGTAWQPLSALPEFAGLFASTPRAGASSPANPDDLTAGDYELDIGACISRGWELVKNNFWPAVGVSALNFILIIAFSQLIGLITNPILQGMIRRQQFSPSGVTIFVLVNILAAPVNFIFMAGLMKYFLNLIRGEEASVGDAFAGFGPVIGQLYLLGLVSILLILIGFVLCIVPCIFLSVVWFFALPLVIDRRMNFWAAMELSRKMVCKHWFVVFAFMIVYGLVKFAGAIACCIGIFVSMPIALAAWMYAYETIFSARKPVSRALARNAALANLLATPGLGSLIGRRWFAGTGQLILAIAGFTLVLIWFFEEIIPYYRLMFSDTPPQVAGYKMLAEGAILFAAAWLWSAVTSFSLLREAAQARVESLKQMAGPATKLDETQIAVALAAIPDWQRNSDVIARAFQFKDFPAAVKFVNAVAAAAEEAWHHPDIDIRWNKVTLALTTHDAGGLTDKDFALAKKFDALSLR